MSGYFVHELAGCAPAPLAAYLKALGVMRVLGTQRDADVRGFWRGDRFVLATRLDHSALLEFFAWDYHPTPLVAPWNGGSGFYPRDNKTGLDAIARSTASRFAEYRDAIAIGQELTCDLDEAPKDQAKVELVRACRARLRGPAAEWLDTAVAYTGDGRLQYPAILGTGGNDGRLDFSNNQMQRLVELLSTDEDEPRGDAEELLAAALFGEPVAGLFSGRAIGQFLPGAAGGPNSTALGWGGSLINPWDFVLMLEGVLLFQVSAVRRLDAYGLPQAAAPFAVRSQAADYVSASPVDESARGEQWMPLWSAPAALCELRALFGVARLQAGTRRARRALDAARAVARQGTARGVRELARFGFIERNGQANLAVPLGRWPVARQPYNHLLDEIELWVDITRQRSGSKYAPVTLGRHVRDIERIMFALCRQGHRPERWCELLCALGHFEDRMVARPRSMSEVHISPVPALSPAWVLAADDGSVELRLAAALASQYSRDGGSIRRHCVPADARHSARYGGRFHITAEGAFGGRDLVWTGLDLVTDLCALAWRRLEQSRVHDLGGFELRGRLPARLEDIHDFLAGAVDDARLAALARGLMAVRWDEHEVPGLALRRGEPGPGQGHQPRAPWQSRELPEPWSPWPVYALFRLFYLPLPAALGEPIGVPAAVHGPLGRPGAVDPAPLRLLLGGRLAEAARLALRRMAPALARREGHQDRTEEVAHRDSSRLAQRLAASLCFPIDGSRSDLADECSDIARLRRALLSWEQGSAMRLEPGMEN